MSYMMAFRIDNETRRALDALREHRQTSVGEYPVQTASRVIRDLIREAAAALAHAPAE